MDQEPSVLDFVKARLRNIVRPSAANAEPTPAIPPWTEEVAAAPVQTSVAQVAPVTSIAFPWRVLLILGVGIFAQLSFEPSPGAERTWQFGFMLYVVAAIFLIWANRRNEAALPAWGETDQTDSQDRQFLQSSTAFILALVLSLGAFVFFGGNRFTLFNGTLWFLAIAFMVYAFWQGPFRLMTNLRDFLTRPRWNFSVDRYTLLLLATICLVLFFRAYRLADVPSQPISDHAEKLWDVQDVLNGQTHIFFERNTGREFFQFYLTAGIILLFKTGLTYMSLKIGTVAAGLGALYYMYQLGLLIGNRRIALLTLVFAGIAYWYNIISRYGLRFPLYPLFYAPALYYLVHGLQTRNRNSFLIGGLFLGLGLHGYSPYRVVPLVLALAVGIYLLHAQSKGYRMQAVWGLVTLAIVSLVVFLPLLRYMSENPDMVMYRAMTRVGSLERPLPQELFQVFVMNLRNSLTMFAWDDGEIWPISVTHRPALDVVTSVLFHLGVVLVLIRYIRQRHWFDLFTLLSIPALMMPSILSLAFPGENPSFNRSGAVLIPVFLIVGLAADSLLSALESVSSVVWNKRYVWVLGAFLLGWAIFQNYDLVFNQYRKQYDLAAWNTTELGEIVRDFYRMTGNTENAYLVGFPHWVDSRLVMINAGFPGRDNAIWPEGFQATLADPRPKLFLININDTADVEALKALYPRGWLTEYQSKYENKNFLLFYVSPQ